MQNKHAHRPPTTYHPPLLLGNLHEFHAGDKTCVFVDAFIPKYDGARVRHFYTPETLLFKPKDRLSHNPCYGA